MRCEEVRLALTSQPGPGPATGSLTVALGHLEQCTECQQSLMPQQALRERLRRLNEVSAPPYLVGRIRDAIGQPATVRRPVGRRVRWVVGGGLLVSSALSLLLLARNPDARIPEGVMRPLVAQASSRLPSMRGASEAPDGVATSNAAQLRRWFAERVPYRVEIPQIDGAALVGGRVIDLAGTPTPAVEYLLHGRPLTFFAFSSGRVMGSSVAGEEIVAGSTDGYHVALWLEHGLARAVVGQLPRSAMMGFAAECRAKALRPS